MFSKTSSGIFFVKRKEFAQTGNLLFDTYQLLLVNKFRNIGVFVNVAVKAMPIGLGFQFSTMETQAILLVQPISFKNVSSGNQI